MLEPVGVLAVAAVCGAAAGLNIGNIPRLRAEAVKEGGGVESACADFDIIGLVKHTALIAPVFLKA